MAVCDLSSLTPMQAGRVKLALEKKARYSGEVRTLGAHLETLKGEKKEGDGMIDWNRTKFNRMDGPAQREYEARLKAKRYFYVDGWRVPKIVYDCIAD